jgi:glycosyltransferase involved in cell wall biosynthesis
MMKILHIGGKMSIGGAERAIFQLIRGQRAAGIEANLLVSDSPGYYGHKVSQTDAKVYEIGMKNGWDISIFNRFFKIIKKHDALHFHGPSPALMFLASRRIDCKLYYTHRAGTFNYPLKRLISYKASGYFLRKAFAGISGNTRHAAQVASHLFRIPHKNIEVTYNGIDFSLLAPQCSSNEILTELGDLRTDVVRIGTTANIRDWKRIDYLIKAIAEIKTLPIHCYIIGDGPAREGLEKLRAELNVNDLITFTGRTKNVADYLQVLDIFVLPSSDSESFGNSAVEAMALGIPTIVMLDGGGLVEHINKKDKEGCIAESYSDLPIYLKKLCQSESLRLTIGQNGKKFVREKYTIEKMVKSYEKLYAVNRACLKKQ